MHLVRISIPAEMRAVIAEGDKPRLLRSSLVAPRSPKPIELRFEIPRVACQQESKPEIKAIRNPMGSGGDEPRTSLTLLSGFDSC